MGFYKVKQELGDLVNDNVRKLESIFPSVIKDGEVDFEELKELLGDFKEIDKEKYEMNWVGKKEAKKIALTPLSGKTLKYIEGDGKNEDTTENLYIEGDNLEVLKLLQNSYYGKVKMIYIDPPYNTGNDFVYNDNFREKKEDIDTQEGNVNEFEERLVKNQKTSSHYHSKWMNMMYSRLLVCKNLLKDDGVIFISIDDNEVHNLRKICDEIFGEDNLISKFIWINNERGRSIDKFISNTNEYILMYGKNINYTKINQRKETGNEILKQYSLKDKKSYYKKGDPLFNNNSKFNIDTRPNLVYSIYVNKITNEKRCIDEKYSKKDGTLDIVKENKLGDDWIKIIPPLRKTNNKIGCWRWGISKFIEENEQELMLVQENNGKYMFYSKNRLNENNEKEYKYKNIINNITGSSGTSELVKLLDTKIFDHPKPVKLLKLLIDQSTDENSIVLDFFSGASTTAHAVMQLNAEDGGNRKYIMVQLPEETDEKSEAYKTGYKNICEIGKKRIRCAGDKILEENKGKEGIENLDIGFKVFRLENSNIRWENQLEENGQIKYDLDGKNIDDIDFVPDTKDIDVVYEILLRHYGIPLTAKIEKLDFIGNRTYAIQDSIIVCLETQITKDIVDKISELEPVKVIFRDSAFGEDISLKQNSVHRLNVLIEKNNKNTTHVVEFI